jgi:hypothetical protein
VLRHPRGANICIFLRLQALDTGAPFAPAIGPTPSHLPRVSFLRFALQFVFGAMLVVASAYAYSTAPSLESAPTRSQLMRDVEMYKPVGDCGSDGSSTASTTEP